jgi:hypothetical protein
MPHDLSSIQYGEGCRARDRQFFGGHRTGWMMARQLDWHSLNTMFQTLTSLKASQSAYIPPARNPP